VTPVGGATLAVAALLLAGCLTTPPPGPTPMAEPVGYLPFTTVDGLAATVGPAPAPGSARDQADRADSDAYRTLEGGDRWLMATAHAELRPPLAAQQFDCALGGRMTVRPMPALTRLMTRLQVDTVAAGTLVRTRSDRPRPAAVDPQRRVCLRLTEAGRASPSWPSTAAAVGTAYGEMFADLAPDRAEAVRRIGREIGVSRAVCALDWPGDVAAGQSLGHSVYAAVAETPAFRHDLEAARAEVSLARTAAGPESPGCAAERRLFPSDG
jgi:acid phosphatase (class A)